MSKWTLADTIAEVKAVEEAQRREYERTRYLDEVSITICLCQILRKRDYRITDDSLYIRPLSDPLNWKYCGDIRDASVVHEIYNRVEELTGKLEG